MLYNAVVVHAGPKGRIVIRDWIATERRALADVFDGLTAEQWAAPSLCEGWTVAHVAAHMTMPFRYSAPRFVLEMVRARGSFHRLNDRIAARDHTVPQAELAAVLRDNAEHPWRPPGAGWEAPLTHDVVHGLDITHPLGIEPVVPAEPLRVVLDSLVAPRASRHFGTSLTGVELRATDLDWAAGDGREVAGRGTDLVLLLAGRRVPDELFDGDGAALVTGVRR
jgi:uncharacterized protein (TIGR03083 family)